MPQTSLHSRFSYSFLHLQREKGFITSLQKQRSHAKIFNRDSKFLYSRVVSWGKKLDLTKNISSSYDESRTHRSTFVQTFVATSDDCKVELGPKYDYGATLQRTFWRKWDGFVTFSRPYNILCTALGVCSVSLLPLTSVGDFSAAYFVGLLQAFIAFVCGSVYTAGFNQLFDGDMDKINKPYLPLISGEFSMTEGKAIVTVVTFMCLAMGIMSQSAPLFIGLLGLLFIGTAYSVELPFLRWKTKPAMAIFSMAGMAGLTIQPGVFYHIQNVLGKPMVLSRSVAFTTIMSAVFGAVLGLIKDLPDFEGDKASGILTYTIIYGKEKVFSLSLYILLIAYGCAVVLGASSSLLICKIVSVIGHTTLASLLIVRANSVDLENPVSTQSFYMFLFKLFYAEYALINFMR